MPKLLFPYKIRISLTQSDADRLAVAADRAGVGITETIRRYVRDGLDRDRITAATKKMPGQTEIESE